MKGTKARIGDEDGPLLRVKVPIRERWAGLCHQLFNTRSLKLDPTIIDLWAPQPLKLSLQDESSVDEMSRAYKAMSSLKAVRPGGLPAELLKIDHLASLSVFTTSLSMFG